MPLLIKDNQLTTRTSRLIRADAGRPCCEHCCAANLRDLDDWCCFSIDALLTLSITNIHAPDGSPIPCGLDADQHFTLRFNRDLAADFTSLTTHERDIGWGDADTHVLYAWVSGGGGSTGFPPWASNSLDVQITTPGGVQITAQIPLTDCCGGSQAGATVILFDPTNSACADLPESGIAVRGDIAITIAAGCCKGDTLLTCVGVPGDCDGACPELP